MNKSEFEKARDEVAFEWVQKGDGSLGHCPECFQSGADWAYDLLSKELEELNKKLGLLKSDRSESVSGGFLIAKEQMYKKFERQAKELAKKDQRIADLEQMISTMRGDRNEKV